MCYHEVCANLPNGKQYVEYSILLLFLRFNTQASAFLIYSLITSAVDLKTQL